MTLYNTSNKEGVDVNVVFTLDTATPEYPAAPFNVGEICKGTDGSEFVYSTTTASIAAYSLVSASGTPGSWTVQAVTNTTAATTYGALAGVLTNAISAISGTQVANFFWVQRAGNVPGLLSLGGATTLNKALHTSATAGRVTSNATASTTYAVAGLVWSTTPGTAAGATAAAIANYPTVGAIDS